MEQEFHLKVELIQDKSESSQTGTLFFSSRPVTFKEIKEKVEEHCSIPECVQRLRYQGSVVPDESTIQSFYLRNGDTLTVSYLHQGQVFEVKRVVKWLQQCIEILTKLQEALKSSGEATLSYESEEVLDDEDPSELLSDHLFSAWSDSTTLVNAQQFKYLGGTHLLVDFHRLLVELRDGWGIWNTYLEYVCCRAIANYARDIDSSREMAQCGGLESCIGSFLMKPANDESLLRNNDYVVLLEALRGIFNIAEIPDVQYELSLRDDVIEQAIVVANTPFDAPDATAKRTISVILCLTRSSEAHKNVMTPDLVRKLLLLLKNHEGAQENSDNLESEKMALMSYVGVVFAQMICGSSHLLQTFPVSILQEMEVIMKQACEGDSALIQEYEESNGFSWGTFSPCIEYLYEPQIQYDSSNKLLIGSLQILAVDVILQYLINSFGQKFHVDIIAEEKVVDYLACLPWILPDGSKERSRKMLKVVTKFYKIQPPLLSIIAKAKLAKSKWGLKKLMNMNTISEFSVLS